MTRNEVIEELAAKLERRAAAVAPVAPDAGSSYRWAADVIREYLEAERAES